MSTFILCYNLQLCQYCAKLPESATSVSPSLSFPVANIESFFDIRIT